MSFQRWNIIGGNVYLKLMMQVKYVQKHRLKSKVWSVDNLVVNNSWCLFKRQI